MTDTPLRINARTIRADSFLNDGARAGLARMLDPNVLRARRDHDLAALVRPLRDTEFGLEITNATQFMLWESGDLTTWDFEQLPATVQDRIRSGYTDFSLDTSPEYTMSLFVEDLGTLYGNTPLSLWQFRHGALIVPISISTEINERRPLSDFVLIDTSPCNSTHDAIRAHAAAQDICAAAARSRCIRNARTHAIDIEIAIKGPLQEG